MTRSLHTLFSALLMVCFSSSCGTAQESPFEYKEIYLPEKDSDNAKDLGLNNLDNDWGIWGHNLHHVLPSNPAPSIYAVVNGNRTDEQFCFSSDKLYEYIVTYIEDNYGESKQHRFAILPCDNAMACTCDQCKSRGNTANNATPAVSYMLERLAKRFKGHIFFTSYYLSTREVPNHKMPKNTGVLVSTMTYPLQATGTKAEEDFKDLLQKWSEKMMHVYVWDYVNNFDDYMTPFPILNIMQRRLQLYKEAGVNGVFFNGSGTDYSTLSQLHFYVIGKLLLNPYDDWKKLVTEYCNEHYPTASDLVANFVIEQEDWAANKNHALPLYGGITQSIATYLPEQQFVKFHQSLAMILPQTDGKERAELETMWQAMALTRLELNRLNHSTDDSEPFLDGLRKLTAKNIRIYSESFWYIDSYFNEYQQMLSHKAEAKRNILLGKQLQPMTALDEEYSDISILTDGLLGLPSNYHCGQMLSSADPHLKIAIPRIVGMKKLKVYLVNNPKYHIILPEKVILSSGGRELGTVIPKTYDAEQKRAVAEFNIPSNASGTLILTLRRNKADRTMSIDEIEGY